MQELIDRIKDRLSEDKGFSGVAFSEITGNWKIDTPPSKILEIAKILRDEFSFDQLRDCVGVDRFTKLNRYECIYNIYSTVTLNRIFLSVKLDSKKPEVDSLCSVWESANWYEREAYDMVGIIFLNHHDLRRIY